MRGSFDPAPINRETESGNSRLRFTAYLGLPEPPSFDVKRTCFGRSPLVELDLTVDGTAVGTTLREVNQLNFYHDVFEVELKRTWDLPSTILERLRPITGGRQNYFGDPSPMDLTKLEDRASWLLAFREIITPWPSSDAKPPNFDLEVRQTERGPNVQDVMALELALARFYCHTVEEVLGRRPTIPLYK